MDVLSRFTLDGSEALEKRLQSVCDLAAADVQARIPAYKLEGLLLAGGYGRGEGGVLATAQGDEPYNDLEFYALIRGNPRVNEKLFAPALRALAEELEKTAGIDIEFKILSRKKLQDSPPSMFYHDLVAGHKCLLGGPALLAGCVHHCRPENIPLSEATRLLMNRCSGLLFAWTRLAGPNFSDKDADFVARNQAKAQLALGDVFLAAQRLHDSSCRRRHERLCHTANLDAAPIPLSALFEHHASGVEFKLHPRRSTASRADLLGRQIEISGLAAKMWLWLEQRRLNCAFASLRDYALSPINKCAEAPAWRNLLINAAVFRSGALTSSKIFRYPRERLLESLPLLLWEPEPAQDPMRLRFVQERLNSRANDFPGLVAAYANVWHRFN